MERVHEKLYIVVSQRKFDDYTCLEYSAKQLLNSFTTVMTKQASNQSINKGASR